MKQPFFILGMGRSGSTLLYKILDLHPKVALTNEGRMADFLLLCCDYAGVSAYREMTVEYCRPTKLYGYVFPDYAERFQRVFVRHAKAILEDFYAEQFAHKDFTHWGDKLPLPETTAALLTAYPNAKFLVLMRDPRDWIASIHVYRQRPDVQDYNPFLAEQSVEQLSSDWANGYDAFERYVTDRHLVRYEDLVSDPSAAIRAALDYLGLEGADELLRRHGDTFTGHGTARSPRASIGRWRTDLSAGDLRAIEQRCGSVMRRYGYELSAGAQ